MLAAIVAIVLIGALAAPRDAAPATSRLPAPKKPLNKPEPASLLRDSGLNLTATQRERIGRIDSNWQAEKSRLQAAMSRFEPGRGRVDQISGSLQDYSQLSREYDATRTHEWGAALDVLTPAQRKELNP